MRLPIFIADDRLLRSEIVLELFSVFSPLFLSPANLRVSLAVRDIELILLSVELLASLSVGRRTSWVQTGGEYSSVSICF
jgi:hypothetical protein